MSKNTSDLKDEELPIGCNVVLWDSLLAGLITGGILSQEITAIDIHPVFCILGGFLGAVLFFILTQIKYINILVLLFSCLVYETLISEKIIEFAQNNFEDFDSIWKWTIYIVLFILIALWHIGSYIAIDITGKFKSDNVSNSAYPERSSYTLSPSIASSITEDWDSLNKRYKTLHNYITMLLADFEETLSSAKAIAELGHGNDYLKASVSTTATAFYYQYKEVQRLKEKTKEEDNYDKTQYIVENMEEHYTAMQHILHQLRKEMQDALAAHKEYQTATQNSSDIDAESLFHGCTDKESLTKRYHNLMKIYHPDNSNGDLSMTQKIQYTYEKLINQYS